MDTMKHYSMPLCVRQNQIGVQTPSEFQKLCTPEPFCTQGNHMRAATGVPETTSGQFLCAPERTSGHHPARLPTPTRTRNYAPVPPCAPEMTSRHDSVRTRKYLPLTAPRCSRNCLQAPPCEDQKLLPCTALCAPENGRHNSMCAPDPEWCTLPLCAPDIVRVPLFTHWNPIRAASCVPRSYLWAAPVCSRN